MRSRRTIRGSALLAVLWLAAALSAIAFSLAVTVRGETERAITATGSARCYYLATGAIERALLYMQYPGTFRNPDGSPRWLPGVPRLYMDFPTGQVQVDIIPESAKININYARPEQLDALLLALGVEPGRSREIVLGILDWRSMPPGGGPSEFDLYYSTLVPSFRARHASFEEIEELLLVKGITPELFYGTYERDAGGRLVPRGALADCVTVYGAMGRIDVNTAEPAVLAAAGLPPDSIAAILRARSVKPFLNMQELNAFAQGVPGAERLGIGGGTVFTLRATARLQPRDGTLPEERRTVSALVKQMPPESQSRERFHILRWQE
jgi:general secretion pathway protein K